MLSPLEEGKGCLDSRAVREFTVRCYLVAIRQNTEYKDINWIKGPLMCLLKDKLSLMLTGNGTTVLQIQYCFTDILLLLILFLHISLCGLKVWI